MRCHPLRWLWGLIPIAMLSWIAVQLERDALERDLQRRAGAVLHAAGHDWASVAFSGRDGLLVGHPADLHVADDATSVVRRVWGVRTVASRFAAGPVAQTPAPAGRSGIGAVPIVPLPEQKPRAALVVASTGAPVGIALREDLSSVALAAVPPVAADEIAAQPPAETALARDHRESAAAALEAPPERPALPATPQVSEATPADADASASAPPANSENALPAPPPDAPAVAAQSEAPQPEVPPAVSPAPPTAHVDAPVVAVPTLPVGGPDASKPAALPVPKTAEPQPAPPLPTSRGAEHLPPPLPQPKAPEPASAPPLPEPAPRFETPALPPGNIASDQACLGDVRLAAMGVEVHFGRGDARLDVAGKGVIDKLVGALGACPQAALRITGHTDATGHRRRNLALSQRRARAVARYMAHKGIDGGRLAAVGYGETRPVAPNDTGANRARNRRIEVVITAPAGSLPPMPVRKQGTRNGLSRR